MADLSSLNFSMTGHEEDKQRLAKESMMADLVNGTLEIQEPEFVIYKLYRKTGRGKVHIDGRDDVIKPGSKTAERPNGLTERIWLLNGVTSIWDSELTEKLRDKDFVQMNIRSLTFDSHGYCRIPKWDTNAIEFAKYCRHNVESPNRRGGSKMEFFVYDPSRQEKALLEKEMMELQLVQAVMALSEEKVRSHASYLGISDVDAAGVRKTIEGLKTELAIRAKRNPDGFSQIINTKEVEVAFIIKQAIIDAKIDIGSAPGQVRWAKGGGLICKLPGGRKPLEYLVEVAMDSTSKEGKLFMEQLKELK